MGYRGKVAERERARELRAQAWTYNEIVAELGVARSSVSLWVRDVEFDESVRSVRAGRNRNRGAQNRGPNKLARAKQAQIARLSAEGHERIGRLSERDHLIAGVALYAGEGDKTDGEVRLANCDPRIITFFCTWLRRFFDVDESRLRVRLYLHEGLDLEVAQHFWVDVTGIPLGQFIKPYRAVADPAIRRTKHLMGCPAVCYSCSRTHRMIMGLIGGLLACRVHDPG